MANSLFLICSMTMYLLVADVKSYILNNDLELRDIENADVEQLKIVRSQSSDEDDRIIGANKVVKMVMNPIIDDVANPSFNTDSSNVLVGSDTTSDVTPIRRNYLTSLMFAGIRAITWRLVKFVVCIFAPMVCSVMNVLSDEAEGGLGTPEGVARGLRFIENVIETYHSAQKHAI